MNVKTLHKLGLCNPSFRLDASGFLELRPDSPLQSLEFEALQDPAEKQMATYYNDMVFKHHHVGGLKNPSNITISLVN